MAHIAIQALADKQEMEISLDTNGWFFLSVNGNPVSETDSGRSKTVSVPLGQKASFVAKAYGLEILNPNVDLAINGNNYDHYSLKIDYSYISDNAEVELKGTFEHKNGHVHDAKNEYLFSQGMMTGVYNRIPM